MKRKNETGLILRTADRAERISAGYLVTQGVSALLLFGAAACLLNMVAGLFSLPGLPALWVGGILACLLRQICVRLRVGRWFFTGVLGVSVLVTALSLRFLSDGLCLVWNHARTRWMAALGRILPELQVHADPEDHTLCLVLLLGVGGLLLGMLACLLTECCRKGAAIAVLVLAAAALLLPGGSVLSAAAAALCAVCLLASHRERGTAGGRLFLLREIAVVLCAALLLAVAGWTVTPAHDGGLKDIRRRMETTVHGWLHEPNGRVLPEGNFDLPWGASSGETLLEVSMEQPETLWLRGFVGQVFDGERWLPAPAETLAAHSDLILGLREAGFDSRTQAVQATLLLTEEMERNRVTVKNLSACGRYAYVPYQLATMDTSGILSQNELSCDVLICRGVMEYSFTVIHRLSAQLPDLLKRLQEGASTDYLRAESSWRTLVGELGLVLPEELPPQMQAALDACCEEYGGRDGLTVEQAELCVLEFVEDYVSGEDRQNILLPLEDYAADTEYQTVTATVLAMRYYGIPARYAEGFVVTEELAASVAPGQPVSVGADCARAWVEIYQDGLGWIPLAEAPGYQTLSGAISESGSQNTGVVPEDPDDIPQGDELEEDPLETEPEQKPQRQPHTGLPENWPVWLVMGAVLLLLLAVTVILLRRRRILVRRNAYFTDADPNEAAAALISDGASMLKRLGLVCSGSLEGLCPAAAERFGGAYGESLRRAHVLNGKARFSSRVLDGEQLACARSFREETLELLKKELKWPERIRAKWLECVY